MTLTEFLLARIGEDEAVATAAGHGCGYLHEHNAGWVEVDLPSGHNARPYYEIRYLRHFDPDRVLAECEAKRRIVASFSEFVGELRAARLHETLILRALALPYADHPDCREEWRP